MNKFKNFLLISIVLVFFLETISFTIYKLNLLEISHKPKLYMSKNFVPNNEWWTEENEWGAWHTKNAKTIQKKSCFNVTYESNEIGARDKSFLSNNKNDIILIGDSFAEGYGVNYTNTSQKYIEDINNFNVLNFGVSLNFGPVQYSIIYNKLASKYKHNKLLIYFLPANDFGENDYNNWSGSKRYRPYYKKINDNLYETFIPNDAIINYSSNTKKIKKIFKDYFWSSALFINLNYQYKIYRSQKKNKLNKFSAYFDAPLNQQQAAIYFLNKIIDNTRADVFLVSIPRIQDFQKLSEGYSLDDVYWNIYFKNKSSQNNNFIFIDLIKYPPNNLHEIFLTCDGHWSPKGNYWAARIISNFLNK